MTEPNSDKPHDGIADYTIEYDRLTRRWRWEFFDDGAYACGGSAASKAEATEAIHVARMEYFDEGAPDGE